jgi:hypothetical protein
MRRTRWIGSACVLGLVLGLIGQTVIGPSAAQAQRSYSVSGADCTTGGGSSCTGCNTGIWHYPAGSPSGCAGGNECVSTSCTGGTASFDTCVESGNPLSTCNQFGSQAAACTGCTEYFSGQCESGGSCSAPPCLAGGGVGTRPIGPWGTWYKCI